MVQRDRTISAIWSKVITAVDIRRLFSASSISWREEARCLGIKEPFIEAFPRAIIKQFGRESRVPFRVPYPDVRRAGFTIKKLSGHKLPELKRHTIFGKVKTLEIATNAVTDLDIYTNPTLIRIIDHFLDNTVDSSNPEFLPECFQCLTAVILRVFDALVTDIFQANVEYQIHWGICLNDFEEVALGTALRITASFGYEGTRKIRRFTLAGGHDAIVSRERQVISDCLNARGSTTAVIQLPIDLGGTIMIPV